MSAAMSGVSSNQRKDAESEEKLEDMLEKLDLTEKEKVTLVVDDEQTAVEEVRMYALIGKVLYRRVLHVNTISDALRLAWGNPRGLSFRPAGDNVFVAQFEQSRDRERILEGGPWTVGKHCVVLEVFNIRSRPSDLRFARLRVWVRVINLPFHTLCPPWPRKIAALIGDVIQIDADARGYAWGDCLRARIWINVHEPLMRWVQLGSAKLKTSELFDIKYENLPYFCFSCGKVGHAEQMCPTPAGRDETGRAPYRESLRFTQARSNGWGGGVGAHTGAGASGMRDWQGGRRRG